MPPTPVLRWSMAAREMGSLCSCNGSKGSCGIFEPEGFRPVRVVMARASVMEDSKVQVRSSQKVFLSTKNGESLIG